MPIYSSCLFTKHLEIATNHIVSLEKTNRQLQARLAQLEGEVTRLRSLNEKISLGVSSTPSPGAQVNMDSRPLSPPPEGSQSTQGPQHELATVEQPGADSSPSASESGF